MSVSETGEITDQVDEMEGLLDELEDIAEDSSNERLEDLSSDVRREAYDLMDDLDRVQEGWQRYDEGVRRNVDEWIDRLEGLRDSYETGSGSNHFHYHNNVQMQPGMWSGMQQQQQSFWGQQQSMGWGNMYQSQRPSGQHQGMGWSGEQQSQEYGDQQQQSQGRQDWFQEFWGQQGDDNPLEDSDEDDTPDDEPVTVVDETTDEDEDYTEPEQTGYDEQDGGDPDGSVDMGTDFGPRSSFDYNGSQELNGATQNFNLSGSGVSISGSVTMQQSVGGEEQYFEASF